MGFWNARMKEAWLRFKVQVAFQEDVGVRPGPTESGVDGVEGLAGIRVKVIMLGYTRKGQGIGTQIHLH